MESLADAFALPNGHEFLVILGMLAATYSTRLVGWLALRGRTVSPVVQRMLDAAPGCVMISLCAPAFMTTDAAALVTLVLTVAVAFRTNLACTIVFAVLMNGLLQHLL